MKHIPIDKEKIPYRADFKLAGKTYELYFEYNAQGDFFTASLRKNGDDLAVGEKLVYGRALFSTIIDDRFPEAALVPHCVSGDETEVNWKNLGESVFLFVYTRDMIPEEEEIERKAPEITLH